MIRFLIPLLLATSFLSAELQVLTLSGSAREESLNKKLVKEAGRLAEKHGAIVTEIDLKNFPLPIFDEDLEKEIGMPEEAKTIQHLFLTSDVIFISSPNYNHSLPALLKNVLDWISRTHDGKRAKGIFKEKRFFLLSASPGKNGGAGGLFHLADILKDLGGLVGEERFSLPLADTAFTDEGTLKDEALQETLDAFVEKALKPTGT